MKNLILFSSVDGQTKKIASELQNILSQYSKTDSSSLVDFKGDINLYDKILIASSIRYGKHNSRIINFVRKNARLLNSKKTFFLSVNLVARKPKKNKPETNPYVIKFLKNTPWKPKLVEVLAGKIDYKKYSLLDKLIIQFIMHLTQGPTHWNTEIEYTDWKRVKEFGIKIATF